MSESNTEVNVLEDFSYFEFYFNSIIDLLNEADISKKERRDIKRMRKKFMKFLPCVSPYVAVNLASTLTVCLTEQYNDNANISECLKLLNTLKEMLIKTKPLIEELVCIKCVVKNIEEYYKILYLPLEDGRVINFQMHDTGKNHLNVILKNISDNTSLNKLEVASDIFNLYLADFMEVTGGNVPECINSLVSRIFPIMVFDHVFIKVFVLLYYNKECKFEVSYDIVHHSYLLTVYDFKTKTTRKYTFSTKFELLKLFFSIKELGIRDIEIIKETFYFMNVRRLNE